MAQLNKTIGQIWEDTYVVPLYQRNFAWGEKQITQLIQDIYDNYKSDKISRYYIGSLVVLLRNNDGKYEVIDGQQRLTTISLLCKALNILSSSKLSYDSRPEVEEFFNGLFNSSGIEAYSKECHKKDLSKIYKLVEALDIISSENIHTNASSPDDKVFSILNIDDIADFANYIMNQVIIVRTELPEDTDVAAYFEIMNNRGEQLQEHEIVKAMMLGKEQMTQQNRAVFSAIWEACSQMNIPIQKTLNDFRLNHALPLFGKDFAGLFSQYIDQYSANDGTQSPASIEEILLNIQVDKPTVFKDSDPENRYSAIIDFPNFLMHVMKMFDDTCPLDADKLQDTYQCIESKLDPMVFIKKLLQMRVLFDRYVIKASSDDEDDDNLKWSLKKPYLSNNSTLKFRNTFGGSSESEPYENEILSDIQDRIIKQESMLQVSFRNRKRKNWLYDILCWLGNHSDIRSISGTELSAFIDEYILNYYSRLFNEEKASKDCSFAALGTNTPHFLFNYIDYLYWVESVTGNKHGIRYVSEVKDFSFSYYNSVEHHLPKSYQETEDVNVDNLGNLCLISRRKNSSLNDKAPNEKAVLSDGLQPKRRIMYKMTKDYKGLWSKSQIDDHFVDVCNLLENGKIILSR